MDIVKQKSLLQQMTSLLLWILGDVQKEQLTAQISWEHLSALLQKNGILQYLSADLLKLRQLAAPAHIISAAKQQKDLTIKKNLVVINTLQKINRAAVGLPFDIVLLKGADLLTNIYHLNMLRPVADVDIYIPAEKYELAIRFFFDLGYRFRQKDRSALRFSKGRRKTHLIPQKGLLAVIDLHLALQTKSLIVADESHIAANVATEPLAAEFANLRRLSNLDRFIFNCDHWVLHHSTEGLKWLIDLILLFEGDVHQNITALVERANQLGMAFSVLAALSLIHSIRGRQFNMDGYIWLPFFSRLGLQQINHDFYNQRFRLRKVKSIFYTILSARSKTDIFRNLKNKALKSFDF